MQRTEIISHLKKNKSLLKSGVDNYINLVDAFFEKSEDRGMDCPLLDVPEEELIEYLEELYFMNLTARIMMRKGVELFCQCGIKSLKYENYPFLDHTLELIRVGGMDNEAKGDYTRDVISGNENKATKWSRNSQMLLYHLLDLL